MENKKFTSIFIKKELKERMLKKIETLNKKLTYPGLIEYLLDQSENWEVSMKIRDNWDEN